MLRDWFAGLSPADIAITCVRCNKPIALHEAVESYTYPHDGRWVHTACVGELLTELLQLMRDVPDNVRLLELEDATD